MTKIKESVLESLIKRVQELRRAQKFKVLYAIGCALNERHVKRSMRPVLRKKILSEVRRIDKESSDLKRVLRNGIDPATGLSPLQIEAQENLVPLH